MHLQVGLRPQVSLPSSSTRSVRAFGFFDDLKKAASDMTDKMKSAAKDTGADAGDAAAKAADTAGDAAKGAADEVKKAADEAGKAVDAAKDAAEK